MHLILYEGQVTVYGLSEQILSEDQQAELTPSSQSAEVFDLFTLLSSLLKPAWTKSSFKKFPPESVIANLM